MATFTRFEDIEAWRRARKLTDAVYEITRRKKFRRDFGLRDQIRRSSSSIMSNIAEGYERSGNGEFVHFLGMAKGSAGEVRSHLYVALDQEYIDDNEFQELCDLVIEIIRMIGGLMNYLKRSSMKGSKYHT